MNGLDEQALKYLEMNGPMSVKDLYEGLRIVNPSISEAEVVDIAFRLAENDKAKLEDTPTGGRSFAEYLKLLDRNIWLYVLLALSFLTSLAIYVLPSEFEVLRWVLGGIFVLLFPGYAGVQVLFPESNGMSLIERLALSVALSMAFVPLVGFLLNYTPWGIALNPVIISLVLLTLGLSAIALYRRYKAHLNR